MNRTELIAAVAEKAGLTKKDAEQAVLATLDTVAAAMAAGRVEMSRLWKAARAP